MWIMKQGARNRKLFRDYAVEFERIFKIKLKTYLDISAPVGLIVGFDIIKFDKDVSTPDGISCKDHVVALYGERAGEIINQLCRIRRLNIPPINREEY